jgi:acylphosphatase
MRLARRYVISGRVQGVGFRYFAEVVAAREGVDGWARNLPDGRVEVYGEGEASALERFERAIRRGPRSSRVDSVETFAATPDATASGFYIR